MRPLWQVHVVDNVEGGGALVCRFHHCLGDGTAITALAQRLFDATPDAPLNREDGPLRPPRAGLFDRMIRPAQQAVAGSARLANATLQGGMDWVRHPSHVLDLPQLALRTMSVAIGTVLMMPDPASPLRGPMGLQRRVAWSEPVQLADVKMIGAATGTKVNDVLVAAMTGALRHYMQAHAAANNGRVIRAVVPVDLRPPERALELGNHFGLAYLDLPVGVSSPLDRLQRVKQSMDAIKRSPEAALFLGVVGIFGQTPKQIEQLALGFFTSKATVTMTNVAGPRQPLYLAGCILDRMMFWVPHPGSISMGISILSYNGLVTLGVVADAGLVPEPEQITLEFQREFARLSAAASAAANAASGPSQALPRSRRPCARPPRAVAGPAAITLWLLGSVYCNVYACRSCIYNGIHCLLTGTIDILVDLDSISVSEN